MFHRSSFNTKSFSPSSWHFGLTVSPPTQPTSGRAAYLWPSVAERERQAKRRRIPSNKALADMIAVIVASGILDEV